MIARLLLATALSAFGTGVLAAPAWIEAPTTADAVAVYPAKARANRMGGDAVLSCTIKPDGHMRDCMAISVSQGGYDFDVAARRLAAKLRLQPGPGARPGDEIIVKLSLSPMLLSQTAQAIDKPAWSALPSAEDFQASFPKAENGVNDVRVALDCGVGAGGVLDDCKVASEEPPGQGYGAGALALAPKFRTALLSTDGAPTVGGRVRLPIHYKLTQVSQVSAKP
jgi:TonB family protein